MRRDRCTQRNALGRHDAHATRVPGDSPCVLRSGMHPQSPHSASALAAAIQDVRLGSRWRRYAYKVGVTNGLTTMVSLRRSTRRWGTEGVGHRRSSQ